MDIISYNKAKKALDGLNSTNEQLAQKVDRVVFDVTTSTMKFYANQELAYEISVSEAGNASAVQSYIDTLVNNGQIEGVTLANGVVTPGKTTFIKTSTNLFDQIKSFSGVLASSDGSLTPSTTYQSFYLDVIGISSITSRRFNRVVAYDNSGKMIEYKGIADTTTGYTYSIPPNTVRVGLSVFNTLANDAQINEGDTLLPYESYHPGILDESIDVNLYLEFENVIKNGNFNGGTEYWHTNSDSTSSITSLDGRLKVEKTGGTPPFNHRAAQNLSLQENHVYYLGIGYYKQSRQHLSEQLSRAVFYYTDGTFENHVITFEDTTDIQSKQVLFKPTKKVSSLQILGYGSTGIYFELDNVQIIDLTDFFGEGNEPSLSAFKRLIDIHFGGYIEGKQNAEIKNLLKQEIAKTSTSDHQELEEISIKLELESSGLDLETGEITPSTLSNWETTKRTGKYLTVLPATPIRLSFDAGKGYILEYDNNFNPIKISQVGTGEELILSTSTNYLKTMVDELVDSQYVNCSLSYMSNNGQPEWVYNDRKSSLPFSFVYEVDTNQGREVLINNDSVTAQYDTNQYHNSALLKLPPNYDPFGKPVKMIIANGGAGSHTTFAQQDYPVMYRPYFDYLADEGYAILDLYKWTTKYMVEPQTNFGSPTSISAIVQAYKWVVKNFNVSDTGVFVWGYSAGGYPSSILDTGKGLPVLATGMFAPAISPLTRPYGYDSQSRLAYADDFGFTGDTEGLLGHEYNATTKTEAVKQYMRDNAPKMIGYNGFWNGLVGVDLDTLVTHAVNDDEGNMANYSNIARIKNVPNKIWVSEDDPAVSADICKVYLQTIKNGHGVGELRLMPNDTGGHYSVTNDPNALKVDIITTRHGVTHTNVPLAFVELVQFYRRYEN